MPRCCTIYVKMRCFLLKYVPGYDVTTLYGKQAKQHLPCDSNFLLSKVPNSDLSTLNENHIYSHKLKVAWPVRRLLMLCKFQIVIIITKSAGSYATAN